ncbi:hypothetical protein HETIRDRAFT_310060, partial [Heterobasidion irregulare TC 32-1]
SNHIRCHSSGANFNLSFTPISSATTTFTSPQETAHGSFMTLKLSLIAILWR